MKKYMIFSIVCILSILCIQCIQAYEYPTIKPFVNDFAEVLTQNEINLLDEHCNNININTSYEIAVVSVKTTDGQDRIEYANRIGENSGVGKAATDNGLVILWTMDNERGIAIAVGRGAETYVNDAKASDIARAARPLMEDGRYYEGFEQMVSQLEQTIKERDENRVGIGTGTKDDSDGLGLIIILIICGVVGLAIYLIIISKRGGQTPGWINSTSIGTGSFGGGGGRGGSFGGGSFGGGGGRG